MTVLYQNRQIRDLERMAAAAGIDEYQLMCAAGQTAWQHLLAQWPQAKRIHVICGKGNNGGDGLVVARLAQQHGLTVTVFLMSPLTDFQGPAAKAAEAVINAKVPCQPFKSDDHFDADVVVDALLGSGLNSEVKDFYRHAIEAINKSNKPLSAENKAFTPTKAPHIVVSFIVMTCISPLSFLPRLHPPLNC
jgi:hydroxyethylthiazole kinase-like uncharacterized protein yjeF